jgi:hypothetical protein
MFITPLYILAKLCTHPDTLQSIDGLKKCDIHIYIYILCIAIDIDIL